MVVTSGSGNLEHAVAQLQDGHVERAAAQVEHEDLLVLVRLVQAIGQSSCRRLVDNTQNLEASDLAGVLGGLTLSVVEVSRNGDDGLRDGRADLLLGVVLQLLQDHGGDFLGRVVLAVDVDNGTTVLACLHLVADLALLVSGFGKGTTDETLDGRNGVLRVGDSLVLSSLTDHALAVLAETFNRWSSAVALGVYENFRLGAFHDGHGGVRGAKVDTQNLAHMLLPLTWSYVTEVKCWWPLPWGLGLFPTIRNIKSKSLAVKLFAK